MPVWVWLTYALAVARVTGLIVADDITAPARDWITERLPARPGFEMVEELLTCPWCMSMWVAAAVIPAAWHVGTEPWMLVPALVLATSQVTGMTSTLGRPTAAAASEAPRAAVTP